MRPPLLGRLGKWPIAVRLRQHQDKNKLSLTVTFVTGPQAPPIAYADVTARILDEAEVEVPVRPTDPAEKSLTPIDHHQIGFYEVLLQEGRDVAFVKLTYQGESLRLPITDIWGLTEESYEV